MGNKGSVNRDRIIQAANQLFYQRGYNLTSFSDIADAAELPRGNFYYYFKSKEDILAAVVDNRLASIRAMLASWELELPNPHARLKRFVQMLRNSASDVTQFGCPIGSLSTELCKTQRPLQSQAAAMLDLFRDWTTSQFQALGQDKTEAANNALHLIAVAQGISLVASVYQDDKLLARETSALDAWLDLQ